MPKQLELHEVSVNYDSFVAVDTVSLSLESGEIGCLLGPSGCGKTTLLRAIAGFEPVSGGKINLLGHSISSPTHLTPPESRHVGMVFQDFALFPHLSVKLNIGFGLNTLARQVRDTRVEELLELVGLSSHANAYPHELSGGQQQRVALARALAPNPDVLLLDEPFSSLDSELREHLASEIRSLLKHNGVTAILVTHDRQEAFAMADRIAVMDCGKVVQYDDPHTLYHQPVNAFVANFIGRGTFIEVAVDANGNLGNGLGQLLPEQLPNSQTRRIKILIRPGDINYDKNSEIKFRIVKKTFRGEQYLYELQLSGDQQVSCSTPSYIDMSVDDLLPVQFDWNAVVVFDAILH